VTELPVYTASSFENGEPRLAVTDPLAVGVYAHQAVPAGASPKHEGDGSPCSSVAARVLTVLLYGSEPTFDAFAKSSFCGPRICCRLTCTCPEPNGLPSCR
jgi:hypothetical protein